MTKRATKLKEISDDNTVHGITIEGGIEIPERKRWLDVLNAMSVGDSFFSVEKKR